MHLGAGRARKEDVLDLGVGLEVKRFVGNRVEADEPLVILHVNDPERVDGAKEAVLSAYQFSQQMVERPRLILGTIT